MNERTNPTDILTYRKKRLRKKRLLPKKKSRVLYEEDNPAIGARVPREIYFEFLNSARSLGLTQKQYLCSLINKTHLDFEEIKKLSFDAGMKTGLTEGHARGLREAVTVGADKIRQQTKREMEERDAIFFPCSNQGCTTLIKIEKGDEYHKVAVDSLLRFGYICKSCDLRRRMASYDKPRPGPRPSWWPRGY